MPRVSFQHRKTEVNLVPIIILSNVLDLASQNLLSAGLNKGNYMKDLSTYNKNKFPERDDYYFKASEYLTSLSDIAKKISNGQQSFDPIKEIIAINLTKNASMDSTELYEALKKLAHDLTNKSLNQSDISFLRTITRTLKETTARED